MSDATKRKDASPVHSGWLLFIHQLPGRPHYLRVKVGRRLREAGAVGIKNTVYVAPNCPPIREALSELVREAQERGGQAVVCEARFVDGLSDETAEDLFRRALDRKYAAIGDAAKRLGLQTGSKSALTEAQRRSIA